jgi:hypothetical protein
MERSPARNCLRRSAQARRRQSLPSPQTPWGEVPGAPNTDACDAFPLLIALGGTRAVWGGFEDCCNGGYGSVTTGAPGTKPKELDSLGQTYHGTDGDFLTGVAGDGKTLVYAVVTVEVVRNFDGCYSAVSAPRPQNCDFKVTEWKVKRVGGGHAARVPNAPPSALIAVSGGRLALVPADRSTATCGDNAPHPLSDCPGNEPRPVRNSRWRRMISSRSALERVRERNRPST